MINVSPSQKKIFLIVLIIGVSFLAAVVLLYLPARKRISRLKDELRDVESQIKQIETIFNDSNTIEEGVRLLKARQEYLISKFPQKEEESLKLLSDFARRVNISIITMKFQPKTVFQDMRNRKLGIDGRICQKIFVSVEMRSNYNDLGRYIETLKSLLPAYVTVESIRIHKGTTNLTITLNLNLYLLS